MDGLSRVLDEFAKSPVEAIAALTVVAGAASTTFKAGRLFWTNLWARLRPKPLVPRETLRIVQSVNQAFGAMPRWEKSP